MSLDQLKLAWERDLPATDLLVLLVLADHAWPDGTHCYPSGGYIAWKTGLSLRKVRSVIADLESRRALRVFRREGRHNEYHLHIDKLPAKPSYRDRDTTGARGALVAPEKVEDIGDLDGTGARGALVAQPVHVVHPTGAPDAPVPVHVVHPTGARGAPEPLSNRESNRKGNPHAARARSSADDQLRAEAESQYALIVDIATASGTSASRCMDEYEAADATDAGITALLAIGGFDAIRTTRRPHDLARDFHFAYLRAARAQTMAS